MLSSAYMSWISFSSADQKTKANTSLDRSIFFFFFLLHFPKDLIDYKTRAIAAGNRGEPNKTLYY